MVRNHSTVASLIHSIVTVKENSIVTVKENSVTVPFFLYIEIIRAYVVIVELW